MEARAVKLTQVKVNAENPRTITKPKFQKLIDSLLAFPAMMELRPVVVDSRMAALGGNMRLTALKEIAKMTPEELAHRLFRIPEYQERNTAERKKLVDYWGEWLEAPTVFIINAKHLTENERQQFMIKDNVSFGSWDFDALANKWPAEKLEAWGMDIWTGKPVELTPMAGGASGISPTDDGDPGHGDALDGIESSLPPELQGVDLTPERLDNIKGDDATPSEHIIITYSPDEREALAGYIGIDAEQLFSKICWRLDELQDLTTANNTNLEEEVRDEE